MYSISRLTGDQRRRVARLVERAPHTVCLDIHGARFRFATNDPGIEERLRESYHFFEVTPTGASLGSDWFDIVSLTASGADYEAVASALLGTSHVPPNVIAIPQFDRIFLTRSLSSANHMTGTLFTAGVVAALYDRFFVLHGSAVCLDGRGVIFPAALRSGKTTLALSFIYQGFRISSDDLVLIDRESLRIYPYPRLFGLREESLQIVPGVSHDFPHMIPSIVYGEPRWFLDKTDAVSEPFDCIGIVFPRLVESTTQLEPVTRSAAALELLEHAFHPRTPTRPRSDAQRDLDTLERLLRQADPFVLRHWDPRESLPLLADRFFDRTLRLR